MSLPPTVLSPADALDCAAWILSDVASRPVSKSRHQHLPLRGKHICRATPPGYCRGSDLKEQIYVAFRVLERSGQRKQDAYCTIADLAASHLGNSRRGRRTRGERDLFSKMKTVASMARQFRQGMGAAENLVNFRIGQFLWLRRAGIENSNPPDDTSASSLELRDDRRDVVVLFLKTESPNTIHDCGQQSLARQVPMLLKRFNQAPLAKFLSSLVTGFGDAISVKRKHVPGRKLLLPHRAIPLSEQSEQRAGGLEPIHLAVASYQET